MDSTLTIPDDLSAEIDRVAASIGEAKSTVVTLAIRAGLPTLSHSAPRPEGYFADMYKDWPEDRIRLEQASSKVDVGSEERKG